MLLNFLDQSTLKTEYVTMKESSSSGEEVKGLGRVNISKRRHKSPISVLPNANLARQRRDTNVYSEERKRFSLFQPKLKSVSPPEQLHIHNYALERKNRSDEFDSKNGDKCYTEESREVPLDTVLFRMKNYQNPFQKQRSRAQSGYSASRDEATHPGDQVQDIVFAYDEEMGVALDDEKASPKEEIVYLPDGCLDNKHNTVEKVVLPFVRKFFKFKKILLCLLLVICIALGGHTLYLEAKTSSLSDKNFTLKTSNNKLWKENDMLLSQIAS
mmetsp:Transcript_6998/g.7847  ORF Transcript_6998/g.7847 Transcript_6998/m.7847 type:complete len:271 (-) Transcript_6998:192-1004(-)